MITQGLHAIPGSDIISHHFSPHSIIHKLIRCTNQTEKETGNWNLLFTEEKKKKNWQAYSRPLPQFSLLVPKYPFHSFSNTHNSLTSPKRPNSVLPTHRVWSWSPGSWGDVQNSLSHPNETPLNLVIYELEGKTACPQHIHPNSRQKHQEQP